jgi:hypothetical protein
MIGTLFVDGVSLWAGALPGWAAARDVLAGGAPLPEGAAALRPAASLLAANERRRAPDSVLVALQVAQEAVAASGHDPATLASVFASAHADLAIVDALCSTLAADPLLLSPTRFHHSVHNAASGYWAIATGCRAGSSSVSAYRESFAMGWLEAAALALADHRPVLLASFETEARGALASVHASQGLLGVALVLAPRPGPASLWRIDAELVEGLSMPGPRTPAGRALAGNALAAALPLFEQLAGGAPGVVTLGLPGRRQLSMRLKPLQHGR